MNVQLPLGLKLPQSATFAAYVRGENALLVSLLQHMAGGQSDEKQLYCWGEQGVGKTHLLQACCHWAAEHQLPAAYVPLRELIAYGPQVLDELHRLKLICIDDINTICGQEDWEKALFSLINQIRISHSALILSGPCSATALGITLGDLISRIGWGPVFHLKSLADADKMVVLQKRASEQGLQLSDEVASFMLNRYDRGLASLCGLLDRLDQAAMVAQRRLTIPFVKSVLDNPHY